MIPWFHFLKMGSVSLMPNPHLFNFIFFLHTGLCLFRLVKLLIELDIKMAWCWDSPLQHSAHCCFFRLHSCISMYCSLLHCLLLPSVSSCCKSPQIPTLLFWDRHVPLLPA